MSKGWTSVAVLFLVLILTAFFFFSPRLFPGGGTQGQVNAKELHVKRFMSLGNSIAHAAFVEDALIMGDEANLTEIVTRLRNDEPELEFIHFTDADGEVLVSSDQTMVGNQYSANVSAADGASVVVERNGLFEGAFAIQIASRNVGVLYIGARPRVSSGVFPASGNPVAIVAGAIVAILAFFITAVSKRRIKSKLVDDMNKRQEEIFSPKIEAMKSAQKDAQGKLDNVKKELAETEDELRKFNEEYESRKREAESNPLVQSIETLKANEGTLIKRIGELKDEENQLNAEISLLSQKREEVLSALEAEKKEERTLHEKLDLIKKKILHLETPGK
ncbi:MAG: hypothetical protein JSU64_04820 [candidate division WOR-3 bacterium]|nr:MAG: hypothetical protein JSU64_04820 [candidate division WOR-3 bacterium]